MTADARRNRGPGRTGGQARRGTQRRPSAARRGSARVAGQRPYRRRPAQPETPTRRGFRLPALPTLRLPFGRRGASAPRRAEQPRPRPEGSPRPAAVTAVLAVLVVLAAVVVGYLAVQLRDARASEAAASNGQVTAARYAEQLLSYHHARLDRDFAEAHRLLTDGFRREYRQATEVVREDAVQDKAVIKASVVATSVVSAEPDEVKTLLFVNQTTTTGDDDASPSIDLNRVVLTLVEEDGRWLVSDLDAL